MNTNAASLAGTSQVRMSPVTSSKQVPCDSEHPVQVWGSQASFPLTPSSFALPCGLLGIFSRNANFQRALGEMSKKGKAHGQMEVVGCSLALCVLAGGLRQPSQKERKHPCLLW